MVQTWNHLQRQYHRAHILLLRKMGERRIARGTDLNDDKLRQWSHRITVRGMRLHRLHHLRQIDK